MRYWLPALAGCICLLLASLVSSLVTFVLVMVALGFFLDAATSLFAAAGGTGNMTDHRQ
jgi:hypothetical protein